MKARALSPGFLVKAAMLAALAYILIDAPRYLPLSIFEFHITLFMVTKMAIWVMVALGLNILTGYNGQISLGHSAFVTIGAYTSILLMARQDWPFWSTIIVGGMFGGATGFLVGIPALRLSGPYLAIATLALAIAAPQVIIKYTDFTGGSAGLGIDRPPPPPFLDFLTEDEWLYYLAVFTAVVLTVLAWNLVRSRIGRAFIAIRDSEVAAQAMGIGLARYKVMAFTISAFYAGIAGAIFAQVIGRVSADSFSILDSINYLTTIVVGGLATILGSVLGGIVFQLVPELTRFLRDQFGWGIAEEAPWAIYGALLIVVMVFMPYGMAGFIHRLGRLRPADLARPLQRWYQQLTAESRAAAGAAASDARGGRELEPPGDPEDDPDRKGGSELR